mmetsp:Transcript_37750/g.87240  ORF Transcript_37750/g.87240 Transcript_37750/m.87240 type:complete len:618 (+) Transcript_37750:63-1916(+)
MSGRLTAFLGLVFVSSSVRGIYLPGANPREYKENDFVELKVNKLTSAKTQLPYDYYYAVPFCKPKAVIDSTRSLGEILKGDRIESSDFEIFFLKNTSTCQKLCTSPMSTEQREQLIEMIAESYMVNWMVDGLSAATKFVSKKQANKVVYSDGFPLGAVDQGKVVLHNHADILLQFHSDEARYEGYRIVGFEVLPRSMNHKASKALDLCATAEVFNLEDNPTEVTFTYTVKWKSSPIRWTHRWDLYRGQAVQGQVHWFAISNSLLMVLLLSAMVAMILLRVLYRDITNYNENSVEDAAEETGWKLVCGDVFRTPPYFELLLVSVGSGVQILGMSVVTLVLAMIGLMSPQYRGSLLQSLLLLFCFMGSLAGYVTGRFTKLLNAGARTKVSWLTATFYPGMFFAIFFILNLMIWGEHSSGAVPFETLFCLLILWFGISVPLVLLGFRKGFYAPVIELPVKISAIPRAIPEQTLMSHPVVMCFAGGLLAFSAIFTELFFIMSSIWQHHFYYLFGFLAVVLCVLVIMCSEVSIALTYFQLCAADHRWWWQSFGAAGSSGVYMFLYSVMYYFTRLDITMMVSTILYFSYMTIASVMFCLLTGAVGVLASFYFVKTIYSSVKID